MKGRWKPCIINVKVWILVPKVQTKLLHIANPRAPCHIFDFFLQLAAVF